MSQGKLEVVKQEMSRVNINILGISESKWTGMGKINSDDHYMYYLGQESLRRNGVAFTVNKSQKCSTWVQSQKWQNNLCSIPRHTIQCHSNPSLCFNNLCQRSLTILWWPTRPSKTNTPKKLSFHQRWLECKNRKSRVIWSNRQVWPWCTKWSRAKANRVRVIATTLFQQCKRWLYI